jgi:uncharacterized membrane protein
MIQNRWKSPVLWTSLAALLYFLLKTFGLLEWIGISKDDFDELTSLIIAVLAAFGVINNPTDSQNL